MPRDLGNRWLAARHSPTAASPSFSASQSSGPRVSMLLGACLWPPSRRGVSGGQGTTPRALSDSLRLRGWHPVTARPLAVLLTAAAPAAERLWLQASGAWSVTAEELEQASVLARSQTDSGKAAGLLQRRAKARLVIYGESSSTPPNGNSGIWVPLPAVEEKRLRRPRASLNMASPTPRSGPNGP